LLADYGNKSAENEGGTKITSRRNIREGRMHENKIFQFTIKMEIFFLQLFFAE
jgi:hypothetical protein